MKTNDRICYPEKRIYIMRDHNWAYYAWDIAKSLNYIKEESSLFHIDAHLDDLSDQLEWEENNWDKVCSLSDSYNYAAKTGIAEFIAPAFAKGLINNIVFVTNEDSQDAFYKDNMVIANRNYTGEHYRSFQDFFESLMKGNLEKLINGRTRILDLDLDYFNLNDRFDCDPELKEEKEIRSVLTALRDISWDFITVAISPEYCGGEDAAKYLYRLFLEVFQLEDNDFCYW